MRRRRNTGILVLLIILAFMAFTIITQSVTQNRQVRQFADGFLCAYQRQDRNALQTKYYAALSVDNDYFMLLDKFNLLGWDITRVNGQPYPMNTQGIGPDGSYIFNTVSANLYYQPVAKLVPPKGHYQRIKHPKYGDCMVVPVTISFSYHPNQQPQWLVKSPDPESDASWILPYEKPLTEPADSILH